MKNKSLINLFFIILLTIFIILTGCGNKSTKRELKSKGYINSFEKIKTDKEIGDFEWETNGYVILEREKKYASKGKYSAKATFLTPSDFLPSTRAAKVKEWFSGMTMSIDTLTKLKVTDWSLYKKFAVDVYAPEKTSTTFYIKLIDAYGKEFITSFPIKPGRNKLQIPLKDVKEKLIDLKNMVSFTLYLDTKNYEKPVVLYIDNIRLIP